ncbi:MAG: GTPase [Anaeromyxobacteraceae bacterium]|nr:GTPase [Anaeromyxobacteraceae bacterium]
MSTVNQAAREIQAKIVYYGPGLSGKTTSLRAIHDGVRPETRGQLVSLATEGDRTLFFDFLPLKVEQVNGLSLRLQLYTVPGQVFYEATRRLVLNGADGVVFVADSQAAAMDANLESMASLDRNLVELGHDPATFPVVVQWNKRDIPGVLPVTALRAALNARGAPEFETVASRGEGTMDALKEVMRQVILSLRGRPPRSDHGAAGLGGSGGAGSVLERRISAMAEGRPVLTPEPGPFAVSPFSPARPPARPAPAPAPSAPGGRPLSFTRLFPGGAASVAEVEEAIREGHFSAAVKAAAHGVADVLGGLEIEERSDSARAALVGMDGRDYLRLLRLARLPEGMGSEADALFALHVLVAARLKADGI